MYQLRTFKPTSKITTNQTLYTFYGHSVCIFSRLFKLVFQVIFSRVLNSAWSQTTMFSFPVNFLYYPAESGAFPNLPLIPL